MDSRTKTTCKDRNLDIRLTVKFENISLNKLSLSRFFQQWEISILLTKNAEITNIKMVLRKRVSSKML